MLFLYWWIDNFFCFGSSR